METLCQPADSTTFSINSRLNFYSFEKSDEILVHIPQRLIYNNLQIFITIGQDTIGRWKGLPGRILRPVPVKINYAPGIYKLSADIRVAGVPKKFISNMELIILKYKSNEVKTDRLTGGLIVNKREFFPFGFYCYSPVHPTLPGEEVVKGFNLMSPYQRIIPDEFKNRKAYMDRCAQVGLRVNYNLLSVSGGGGVSSRIEGITDSQKMELLRNEILSFRDHPALLAWYISDEPTGNRVSPEYLEEVYNTVKELDPWHPVTIVFMAPFISSVKYAYALDIVMADPYPIPVYPSTMAGDVASQLSRAFKGKKPVWMVPQAFGGGEWWEREPTLQEMRAMTYQSIIRGARGIQYFVRQGLNLFPKSVPAWNECGRMATEIAELTPWLLSSEETVSVTSGNQNIIVNSWLHDGRLMIMAANRTNSPQRADYKVSGSFTGRVGVIFENRSVSSNSGYFSDQLSALGTQVYMIDLKPRKEINKPYRGNLLKDPGFENVSSPGIPSACYARNGGDRGATYFTDTREHFEGDHSVRLVTPLENRSIRLRFFPIVAYNDKTYMISVRAKGDPDIGLPADSINNNPKYFEISLGDYGTTRHELSSEWKEFVTIVTIPYYTQAPGRLNVILQMPSAGVGWFDLVQIFEAVDINRSINPELRIDQF